MVNVNNFTEILRTTLSLLSWFPGLTLSLFVRKHKHFKTFLIFKHIKVSLLQNENKIKEKTNGNQ